jgi:hypothetical protein
MLNGQGYNVNHPRISNVSLFIPHPVSIYVTHNTFIQYGVNDDPSNDSIGMVVQIDAVEQHLHVRRFFSWAQLMYQISPVRLENVSFWKRHNSTRPPMYLCDSDVVVDILASNVKGLAFVFHESDPVVRQLDGMANTFVVSSVFNSQSMIVRHVRSFFSFPCHHNFPLPTCCSSMIFEQMMRIKGKMQLALNTRSMNSKNVQTINLENISRLTWHYMTRMAVNYGLEIANSYGTVRTTFMEGDSCVVQKWRDIQETFSLNTPEHFHFAKLLFGTCVGLGVRAVIPVNLKNTPRLERAENYHSIHVGDTINVVPFTHRGHESVGRGLYFRYMGSTCNLTITIRFSQLTRPSQIRAALRARHVATVDLPDDMSSEGSGTGNGDGIDDATVATPEGNVWPFHADTEINSSKISYIDLENRRVATEDGSFYSFNDAIQHLNSLIR